MAKPPGLKPVGVALFGAGRAGTIHLANLAKNPRVNLLYIVEDIKTKWTPLLDYWNLKETKFLASDKAAAVYEDDRLVYSFI